MTAAARTPRPIGGRHVLFAVIGFFAVVIGLDSLFVVWAVDTYPGEVSSRAYEDGLAFNRTIAARRDQARLGWRATVVQGAAPGSVRVRISDAVGRPMEDLHLSAAFTRPATDQGSRRSALRSIGKGEYVGGPPLAPGVWDLTLTARGPGGQPFEARRRLVWR